MAFIFRTAYRGSGLVRSNFSLLNDIRSFSSKTILGKLRSQPNSAYFQKAAVGLGFCGVGVGAAVYLNNNKDTLNQYLKNVLNAFVVSAAAGESGGPCKIKVSKPCAQKKKPCCEYQCNITSPMKTYSLYLWITLEPGADPNAVACSAVRIDEAIEAARNPCGCNEDIVAGVGFGPNLWAQVMGSGCKNFCYRHRKGKNGEMPSTDGDIFVHAKCDSHGQLFEFCKQYMHGFPECSILEFEDVYGFDFKNGRDISGFLDNQTNRCKEDGLREVAIDCESGGSYALAQKWVHDFCVVDDDPCQLEQYIGREMASGNELCNKSCSSHVARMNGSTEMNAPPQFEIVRQSQSYGTFSDKAGMFFLAFCNDPSTFDCLLDRMVGASCDGEHDDVMKMSKNVKGAYWYFPGIKELEQIRQQ
ncbi:deferrochelatase/peroxidase YfeX [Biomphalaria pfeifferi]|uniref:Deferrochelatase/peroxidase YfeX n=1 Tax=Biomphalaria pfeifferi TaxID=112525 RepID=A0AAD8F0S4_BIOPF|nr:deferrochelatase/peroxidase YfeX [Biomphalaria pfeifferi]